MFQHSERYGKLVVACNDIHAVLKEMFVEEFVEYLHECFEQQLKRETEDVSFLAWLGEAAKFSNVVTSRGADLEMYDILPDALTVFDSVNEFRKEVETVLNAVYEPDGPGYMFLHLEEISADVESLELGGGVHDLLTFEYRPTYIWAD